MPLGFADPLPSNVTVLPTATDWLGPGFAMGGAGAVENAHDSLEKSNGIEALVRIVKVLLLVTSLLAGTGAKFSVPCPGTTRTVNGSRLVSVAVTEVRARPQLTTSAL